MSDFCRIIDDVTKQLQTWSPRLILGMCTVFDADFEYDAFRVPFQFFKIGILIYFLAMGTLQTTPYFLSYTWTLDLLGCGP